MWAKEAAVTIIPETANSMWIVPTVPVADKWRSIFQGKL